MRIIVLFIMCANLLFASEKSVFFPEKSVQEFEDSMQDISKLLNALLPKQEDSEFGKVEDVKKTLTDMLSYVYVKVPKEYIPFANSLKAVFPLKDNQVDCSLSYGEAKKILSPLKDAYMDLVKSDKTYQFLKSLEAYEGSFGRYRSDFSNKHVHEVRIFPTISILNYLKMLDFLKNPCDDAYRVFILYSLNNIGLFFRYCKNYGYSYNVIASEARHMNFMIAQPKEVIDQYCPLSFQKLIFPFYFIDFFLTCINACEGFYSRLGNTQMFNDRFSDDTPFIELLATALSCNDFPHPQRLIENFYLMTEDPFLFEEE